MSGDNEAKLCCASCGMAEIDDIKLMPCDDCDLVKYCSDECKDYHKSDHEEACRERAAELRDELLFKQPESSCLGDCPICTLPLPLDTDKFSSTTCCSKNICNGCVIANAKRAMEMRLQRACPFCREPTPSTREEANRLKMKRVEANDPNAMRKEGAAQYNKGEYRRAFEYYTKAAKLGNAWAHYNLSCLYRDGEGVERDTEKGLHHLEEAAIGGHPEARYFLGYIEWEIGNVERAVKHFIIAATQGDDDAIKALMGAFKSGLLEKEVLAAALRSQKAAVDATKSPQRKAAEKYVKGY